MRLGRSVIVAASLMLLTPGLIVAVAALSGIGHRWIDILAQFVAPALAATLVVTLALAVWRKAQLTGLGVIVSLLLLIAAWPQWFVANGAFRPETPIIRVYSANLWARNTDVDAMRRSIAASDADILMLVEVGEAPMARIDDLLAGYPHRLYQGRRSRPIGTDRAVIASRYPLTLIPDPHDGLSSVMGLVQTPVGPVSLMAVHLTRPWPFRVQRGQVTQAASIARRRVAIPGPLIVAGDFNSVSSARIGRQVQSDAGLIPAPGWPGTWPSALPAFAAMTIDQVYRSPDLALVDRRLGRHTGSDHRPVITEFTTAVQP